MSNLVVRKDKHNDKGMKVNDLLFIKCREQSIGFINNSNIGMNHLNNSGLHLNESGTNMLANNFLKVIRV